jgi:hypothetical protein
MFKKINSINKNKENDNVINSDWLIIYFLTYLCLVYKNKLNIKKVKAKDNI